MNLQQHLETQLARIGENLPAVPSAALDLARAMAGAGDPLRPYVADALRVLVDELVGRYPYSSGSAKVKPWLRGQADPESPE